MAQGHRTELRAAPHRIGRAVNLPDSKVAMATPSGRPGGGPRRWHGAVQSTEVRHLRNERSSVITDNSCQAAKVSHRASGGLGGEGVVGDQPAADPPSVDRMQQPGRSRGSSRCRDGRSQPRHLAGCVGPGSSPTRTPSRCRPRPGGCPGGVPGSWRHVRDHNGQPGEMAVRSRLGTSAFRDPSGLRLSHRAMGPRCSEETAVS